MNAQLRGIDGVDCPNCQRLRQPANKEMTVAFNHNRFLCVLINISGENHNQPVMPLHVTGFVSTEQQICGISYFC